jgi:hypothetical protein
VGVAVRVEVGVWEAVGEGDKVGVSVRGWYGVGVAVSIIAIAGVVIIR